MAADLRTSISTRNTRQQILGATQRLIETGGFSRLTTREIAREAGCAEGTIFKHFKRKEDLCLAVVLENSPKFKDTIAQKRPGKGSVRKNLEDIALASIRFCDKLIPLAAALFADARLLMRHRQRLRESGGGPKDAFALIAAYISEEQQLGRINREAVPLAVAALILGPCFYWAFVRQGMGMNLLPMNDQEFASCLVGTLTRGLSPTARVSTGEKEPHAKS
jgi:AcrR family transcriptional regulator